MYGKTQQVAHKLVGQAKRSVTEFNPKTQEAAFSTVVSNFDKCQMEVASDVISDLAVDHIAMDVRVKFSDSTLNRGRIIPLFAGRIH